MQLVRMQLVVSQISSAQGHRAASPTVGGADMSTLWAGELEEVEVSGRR